MSRIAQLRAHLSAVNTLQKEDLSTIAYAVWAVLMDRFLRNGLPTGAHFWIESNGRGWPQLLVVTCPERDIGDILVWTSWTMFSAAAQSSIGGLAGRRDCPLDRLRDNVERRHSGSDALAARSNICPIVLRVRELIRIPPKERLAELVHYMLQPGPCILGAMNYLYPDSVFSGGDAVFSDTDIVSPGMDSMLPDADTALVDLLR